MSLRVPASMWLIATLSLSAIGLHAQVAPPVPANDTPPPNAKKDVAVTTTPSDSKSNDETITLSPFQVVADTKGYFSSNSMSGTRFNTKVEDLASSLTVITKEQMDDFAMLDVNDVLNYTAGTEGTATYTDYTIDRNGQLLDNIQVDPNNANRVRGILAANQSYGNIEVNRMVSDRLIIDGIEVSRGPNANVFGLGYAAGTVNQVPASANLKREQTRVEFRADSYGGYRSALDLNRVLKPGVLAIRVSGALQHDGFVRKPSGMNTVRYNGFVKFRPFPNTTISASYLHYRSNGNRPNFTPPRDDITDWVNAGKPTWDPILQIIHVNGQTIDKNGVVTGGRAIVPIAADANIPSYIPLSRSPNNSRSMLYVDQNGINYWTAPGTTSMTVAFPTPAANGTAARLMMSFPLGASGGKYTGQPLWTTTPTIGDHSYYDWSSINLAAPNRQMDKVDTSTVQIDQVLLNTPRQSLFVQGAILREDSMRYQRQPLGNSGISGQTGQYFVDVDEKRLDGTPNPFLGRPYIAAGEFTTRWSPAKWDTYRLQAAYKLDLRNEKNWLKWLGLHEVTAYDEYKYRITRQWAYRETITSNNFWTTSNYPGFAQNTARANQSSVPGGPQAGANIIREYYRYYVGGPGTNVQYAPGDFKAGTYPYNWGGYKTFTNTVIDPTSAVFYNDPATLTLMPTTDQTAGSNNLKQIIKTPGAVIQSHLLDDKVVTTFGVREDRVYSKNAINAVTAATPVGGPNLINNNTDFDWAYNNSWQPGDYRYNAGKTKTAGIVARPFRDFKFVNSLANSRGPLGWLGQAMRGLSLTYNQSDNFVPQAPAIDLFMQPLPNVTGTGKDYGFWMNFADNKVVIRFNHYITRQLNIRNGDANTIMNRVVRIDLDVASDAYELAPRATNWWTVLHPEWTPAQVKQAVSDQIKIPVATWDTLAAAFRASTLAATNDYIGTGNEVEINVNPTRYWRLSGSFTQQKAITANVSPVLDAWVAQRMSVWTTIVDLNTLPGNGATGANAAWAADATNPDHLWWLHAYNSGQTPQQNYANNVAAPFKVIKQQEGKSKPSVRQYGVKFATSLDLAAFTGNRYLKNVRVGMSGNWQDKGAIGYYGVQSLPTVVTDLDVNRPIWDKARLYVNGFVSYRTKLFHDKIGANFQFNVENIGENGRLQPIGAFPDGTTNAYRIVDPQKFILSASFDL